MIISRARSFVVVDIPGSLDPAMRATLLAFHDDPISFDGVSRTSYLELPLDHAHLRSWELQMCYPEVFGLFETCRSLAFFRNPAERFVSAVFAFHDTHQPELDIRHAPRETQRSLVRAFAAVFETHAAIADPRFVGFSPQTWFTHLHRRRLVKTILPLAAGVEAYRAGLMVLELPPRAAIPAIDPPIDAPSLLGDAMAARVRALYKDDYDVCAASDHLAPLLTP